MKLYKKGNVTRLKAKWTIPAGGAPGTVAFEVIDPAKNLRVYTYGTDVEVVQDDPLDYHLDLPLTASGPWHVRSVSTGNGQAADEETILVEDSNF